MSPHAGSLSLSLCVCVCVCVCVLKRDSTPEGLLSAGRGSAEIKNGELWCKDVLILCLEETQTLNILKGGGCRCFFCAFVCVHFRVHVLCDRGRNRLTALIRRWWECVRSSKQLAGRLQVQIRFPSAPLLIKQLNGQRKVMLRVKSVKEKDTLSHTLTHTHTHTHTQTACTWPSSRAAVFGIQTDWYSHKLARLIFQCNQHALQHTSTSVQNISAWLFSQFHSVIT